MNFLFSNFISEDIVLMNFLLDDIVFMNSLFEYRYSEISHIGIYIYTHS